MSGVPVLAGLCLEVRLCRAQDAERGRDMDGQHRLELLVRHSLNDVVPGIARVVYDDVERPESVHGSCDDTVAEIRRGHVACADHGGAAIGGDLGRSGVGDISVEIVDDQFRTLGRELPGNCLADALAGSGDDRHLSLEFACHWVSL